MRRQVKPFVTEYRGSVRRAKDPPPGDLQPDIQAPRARSYADAHKVFQSEAPDHSYEAALRAADALFSSGRDDQSSRDTAASTIEPELRASSVRSQPEALTGGTMAEEPTAHAAVLPTSPDREPAAAPRRILQAIEPPAEDRFAALEAERAPKRRGRKPGSKNKPKHLVGDDWTALAAQPALATVRALPVARAPRPFLAAPVVLAPALADLPDDAPDGQGDDEQAMPQPRGRNDKFGWKRNGLRPGERWKRRLPKAAR